MRKHLLLFLILLPMLVIWSYDPPRVEAQSDTWFELPTDWFYDTGTRHGCSTYNGDIFNFTNPPAATLRAVVYDFTLVEHNASNVWMSPNFNSGGLLNIPSTIGGLITLGTRSNLCIGPNEAGHAVGCETMGYTAFDFLTTWNSTPTQPGQSSTLQTRFEVNCGWDNTARGQYSNFRLIYYGVEPTDADFIASPSSGGAPLDVDFTDTSTGPVETWDWYIDEEVTPFSSSQNPAHTFTDPGIYWITLIVNAGMQNESQVSKQVTVNAMVRPFHASDEGAATGTLANQTTTLVTGYSLVDSPTFNGTDDSVIAFSNQHAVVYAADEGVVTSIYPATSARCNSSDNECYVVFQDLYLIGNQPYASFSYLLNEVYVVTIQVETNRFLRYLVTNPGDYVQVGETVGAGCPLGETIGFSRRYAGANAFLGPIGDFVASIILNYFGQDPDEWRDLAATIGIAAPVADAEFTVIQHVLEVSGTSYLIPLVNSLAEYPEAEARACEYQPSACLNPDSTLKRPELWNQTGLVEFASGGGVVLNPGARIDMQLNLDSETAYVVEAWARSMQSTPGSFTAQIGQTLETFTTPGPTFQQFTIPAATHSPDLGLFYTLSVSNTGTIPVLIQSVCAHEDGSGVSFATCVFVNPSFDGLPGAQGWTTTGDVNDGISPGEILMYDGDTIAQNVRLLPDGINPYTYVLEVTATVGGASPDALKSDFDSDVGFLWDLGGSGYTELTAPNSATTYEVGNFFLGAENGINLLPNAEVKFYGYIEVSTLTSAALTIKADVNSTSNLFLRVRHACIVNPVVEYGDDAFIPDPPYTPNCTLIAAPADNEIGSWIFYHWSNLDRFFQCDLLTLMNRMHETAQKTYSLIGWEIRYQHAMLIRWVNWLTDDLTGWLDGHFRNMAIGQVTTIQNNPEATLWDVLLALINVVLGPLMDMINQILSMVLGIIGQVVTLLFSIIEAIISLVLHLLVQALSLLNLAQYVLTMIVSAYNNATPVSLPGMSDCSADPQASSWCISMWVLENTVFSGAGVAIVPILTGILSIHLILWIVDELKDTVVSLGQSS